MPMLHTNTQSLCPGTIASLDNNPSTTIFAERINLNSHCQERSGEPETNKTLIDVIISIHNAEKSRYRNKGHICCIDGCDRPAKNKGYCLKHLARIQRGGMLPDGTIPVKFVACKVDGCGQKARSKGYCFKHYERMKTGRMLPDGTLIREDGGISNYIKRYTTTGERAICKIDGCENHVNYWGLCHKHIARFKTGRMLENGELAKLPKKTYRKRSRSKLLVQQEADLKSFTADLLLHSAFGIRHSSAFNKGGDIAVNN